MGNEQDRWISGVAITGTIGAGKTALAEALSELMESKGLRHALIDVDWLGQVYPPPDSATSPHSYDLAFTNLSTIAPNFIRAGSRYLVVAVTLVSREEEELQAPRRCTCFQGQGAEGHRGGQLPRP